VSGTGKTLEEARLNALRSAIEQAFGAFISSKTEILNDNLVKDEIVSIANGNVQKYDVVSQVELPNAGYAITLSATVSIDRLISFAESRGVVVEFKGGMFAQNIKLQKLNEQSEEKATKNLVEVYLQLLENSFDFSLVSSEPVLVAGQSDVYKINFIVKTVANDNYSKFINYFKETLDKVQAIDDEATNIIKVGKPLYYLIIDEKVYKFRSINSFHYIDKFFISSQLLSTSFKVTSNLGIYKYSFKEIFGYYRSFFPDNKLVLLNSRTVIKREDYIIGFDLKKFSSKELNYFNYYKDDHNYSKYLSSLFSFFIQNNIQYKSLSDLNEVQICPIPDLYKGVSVDYKNIYEKFREEKMMKYFYQYNAPINIDDTVYFNTNFNQPTYTYDINFKLSELEKITSFKIEKIPFLEYINNLNNYVELENKQ
jgi:hypothetical protein